MKKITLGYSPCPNDTFMFYAMVHGRIDTGDLAFMEVIRDVETLNQMARNSEIDVTKASFHAHGHLRDRYFLLRSGGALGKGCGPVLVAREEYDIRDLRGRTIAVPGRLTTALLLLQIFDTALAGNVRVMPFHEIMGSVRSGEVDAGLLIHEGRFTYQGHGLKKIKDLGEWWEGETGLPLPLGGILANREMGHELALRVEALLKKSVEYAFSRRDEPMSYIKRYAQEMDDLVINQHIDLYVNKYSLDMGQDGKDAIYELFRRAEEKGLVPSSSAAMFA